MVLRSAGVLPWPVRSFLRSALPCLAQRHACSCCRFSACLFWPVCGGQLLTSRRVGHGAEIVTDPRLHRPPHPALTRAPSAVLAHAIHAIPASSTFLSQRQLFSRSLLLCACFLVDVLPPAIASQSTHAGNRGGRVVPLLRAALWCPCSTLAVHFGCTLVPLFDTCRRTRHVRPRAPDSRARMTWRCGACAVLTWLRWNGRVHCKDRSGATQRASSARAWTRP
jgi:hypothetical protein